MMHINFKSKINICFLKVNLIIFNQNVSNVLIKKLFHLDVLYVKKDIALLLFYHDFNI